MPVFRVYRKPDGTFTFDPRGADYFTAFSFDSKEGMMRPVKLSCRGVPTIYVDWANLPFMPTEVIQYHRHFAGNVNEDHFSFDPQGIIWSHGAFTYLFK